MNQRRVLVAVLVYGGSSFVPACLESAARMTSASGRVDVLVLDDCSPEPGWSEGLATRCDDLGLQYYRSPRNLGIPRNMNLALLRAVSGDYDHVMVVNSDVVLPSNMVERMVAVADSEPRVGSVTAWSNKVSVFSVPNVDTTGAIARPDVVDWVSGHLAEEFGSSGLEIPTAVGFCMLIPTPVVRHVGLFDPLYGRGYCEEVDWSLRATSLGYRALLGLPVFVYHMGSASTLEAGMGMQMVGDDRLPWVADHERIIDYRYPSYRAAVLAFLRSGTMTRHQARATHSLVVGAAQRFGYTLEASCFSPQPGGTTVRLVVQPDGPEPVFSATFCGFSTALAFPDGDVPAKLLEVMGRPPDEVVVSDRGRFADRLADAQWNVPFLVDRRGYPQRV